MSNLNLASIQDDDNASPSVTSPDFLTVGVDGHHYAVNPSHSQLNNGTHVDQLDSFNSITVTPSVVRDAPSIPSRQDDMDPETDLDSSSDVTYDSHVSEFPRLTDATGLDAPASPWKEDGPHPSTWETEYQLWRTPDSPFLDRMKALRRERKVREKLKRIIEDPSLRDLPGSTVVPGEIDTILTALAARESRTTRHKDSCGRTQSSNDSTPHLTTLALAAIGNEFNVSDSGTPKTSKTSTESTSSTPPMASGDMSPPGGFAVLRAGDSSTSSSDENDVHSLDAVTLGIVGSRHHATSARSSEAGADPANRGQEVARPDTQRFHDAMALFRDGDADSSHATEPPPSYAIRDPHGHSPRVNRITSHEYMQSLDGNFCGEQRGEPTPHFEHLYRPAEHHKVLYHGQSIYQAFDGQWYSQDTTPQIDDGPYFENSFIQHFPAPYNGFTPPGEYAQPRRQAHPFRDYGCYPQPQGQAYSTQDYGYYPQIERQAHPADGYDHHLQHWGQAYPGQGCDYYPQPRGQLYPNQGFQVQPFDDLYHQGYQSDQAPYGAGPPRMHPLQASACVTMQFEAAKAQYLYDLNFPRNHDGVRVRPSIMLPQSKSRPWAPNPAGLEFVPGNIQSTAIFGPQPAVTQLPHSPGNWVPSSTARISPRAVNFAQSFPTREVLHAPASTVSQAQHPEAPRPQSASLVQPRTQHPLNTRQNDHTMPPHPTSRAAAQLPTIPSSTTLQSPNTRQNRQAFTSRPASRDAMLIEVGRDRRHNKLSYREQTKRQTVGVCPSLNGGPLTNFDGRPISSDSSNSSVDQGNAGGAVLPPRQRQSEFGRQRARQLASMVTGHALSNAPASATLQPLDIGPPAIPLRDLTGVRMSRNVDVPDTFVESIEAGDKYSFSNIHELAVATELLPLTDPICEQDRNVQSMVSARADESSIICVNNIPFNASRHDVLAFLQFSTPWKVNRDGALRVHFHIDRASFKTYEAYIELDDPETGGSLVRDFASTGRMVEARVVTVTLSTKEKLMSILFPKAKCVDWIPSGPEIREPQMGETPFHGFVSQEELFQIHRAAETPRKVKHADRAPSRPFDDMLSLISKYPWYKVDVVTIGERARFFKTFMQMLRILKQTQRQHDCPLAYTGLLREFVIAGSTCAGFAEAQRWEILSEDTNGLPIPITVHPFIAAWPFKVIQRNVRVNDRRLECFAKILTEHSSVRSGVQPTDMNVFALQCAPLDTASGRYHYDDPEDRLAALTLYEVLEWEKRELLALLELAFK